MTDNYLPPAWAGQISENEWIPAPPAAAVDERAAAALLDAVRDVAASVSARGVSGAERLARARLAADQARDAHDVAPLLSPYADGQHSRLLDLAALHPHAAHRRDVDHAGAAERLGLDRLHRQLSTQLRAIADQSTGDIAALLPRPIATAPTRPTAAAWLNSAAVTPAAEPLGKGRTIVTSPTRPPAALDPAEKSEITAGKVTVNGVDVDWHLAAHAVDVSEQVYAFSVDEATQIETAMADAVDVTLEAALLGDLAVAAVAATTFEEAEAAVAATGFPADTVLVNPADAPTVRRQYATTFAGSTPWLTVLPTAGQPAGTVLVLATPAVYATATPPEWLVARAPGLLGVDLAVMRYALAGPRLAGAAATVDLTPTP